MRFIPILALALALVLSACGDDTRQAGGVTRSEAEALDDAAEMIEQQRLPVGAVTPPAPASPAPAAAQSPPAKPGG